MPYCVSEPSYDSNEAVELEYEKDLAADVPLADSDGESEDDVEVDYGDDEEYDDEDTDVENGEDEVGESVSTEDV